MQGIDYGVMPVDFNRCNFLAKTFFSASPSKVWSQTDTPLLLVLASHLTMVSKASNRTPPIASKLTPVNTLPTPIISSLLSEPND